jgi:hypothetical protein
MHATAQSRNVPGLKFLALLRDSMLAHGPFWMVFAVYYFAYSVLHMLRPDLRKAHVVSGAIDLMVSAAQLALLCVALTFLGWLSVWLVTSIRNGQHERPLEALLHSVRQFAATMPQRVANGLPIMLIMAAVLFMTSDIQGKTLAINPETWDGYFAALEAKLHFGYQPWELLQPLLGTPAASFVLSLNYSIWFLALWTFFVYFAFTTAPTLLRTRFFLTFIVTWVFAGNLLALIFSSGGPCYFSRLGLTPDSFAGLMDYLRQANDVYPIWALSIQDLLWDGHINNVPLSMISAMPSLHNAAALLFVLAGYQISRPIGHLLTLHAVLIFLGSVHLGWHYAVDSYVSWPIVLGVWWASKPVAAWWHDRTIPAKAIP